MTSRDKLQEHPASMGFGIRMARTPSVLPVFTTRAVLRASAWVAASGLCAVLAACGGGGNGGGGFLPILPPAPAPAPAPPAPPTAGPTAEQLKSTCNTLNGQVIEGVSITKTTRFEAKAPLYASGFCQLLGTRAPFLDIEIDVPDNWTGRYWQQGGGGFDGRIPSAVTMDTGGAVMAVDATLALKGAVYAASNGGNRASVPAQAAPGVWVSGTPEGQQSAIDYAYAAGGTTLRFGKAVAKAFFGKAPSRSYFNGCSNGGRNAYIAAQRWPDEFDGIVAGCETMDMGGAVTGLMNTAAKAATPAEIGPAQYAAAYTAAVAACDASDGATDGYLANPGACTLPAASLQCGQPGANADPTLCLSAAQVPTLAGLLGNLTLSTGATAYSSYSWTNFAPASTIPSVPALGVTSYGGLGGGFAFLATNDPLWFGAPPPGTALAPNLASFDINRDYYLFSSGLLRLGADHDKNAIAAYVASGHKLLSWHDAGDPLLSVNDHARNFATMTHSAKGMGLADPRSNARMFIVPASTHGAGANLAEVDWLGAIIDWVESGKAPDQLTYKFMAGATARTMPVCEAPKYPRYNGTGDVNAAASFTCTP
ncbi:tannase/feruloyl esterase family alpha/beta hydrolase [Variovorax sp. PAMC26660]|uniref:tannase/feruloyl esterase family alpha/beta hydrolase n=1 Tax=Variovorax sp. PAMC26660 TaxID=2762322 RepID=UPI00164E3841|nr:tannase/feruloyl esterase family alpha/beta hydrolase [Variovorax sp. PAMC26660]QNK67146.1 tannase/feruloyl esterase family alpha/beta hydrolase [Variovorax sp. PAMC26660]